MTTPKRSVCVFCGAQNAVPKTFLDLGAKVGTAFAQENFRLIYGGGDCGVMGAVANAVMRGKGNVTGVFPVSLRNIENEHQSLTEILLVGSMHERKKTMFDLSDAFVVLPGGFGTMDEMFEILTWKQLKMHNKPLIIFNYDGYWDPLLALMHSIIETGFALPETSTYYTVVRTLPELLDALGN